MALMMFAIFSGIFGISAYATLPQALSTNRGELTQGQMLDALRAIDRQLHEAAQPLDRHYADLVLAALLVSPLPAAPPVAEPGTRDQVPQVLFLGEKRPLRFRLDVRIKGHPFQRAWEDYMGGLFAHAGLWRGLFWTFALSKGMAARRLPVKTGVQRMIGMNGEVRGSQKLKRPPGFSADGAASFGGAASSAMAGAPR